LQVTPLELYSRSGFWQLAWPPGLSNITHQLVGIEKQRTGMVDFEGFGLQQLVVELESMSYLNSFKDFVS